MQTYTIREITFKLRYTDLPGTETPIVFIHGLGCTGSFDYPKVAQTPCLSEHRRIMIDLLGAGYSDKPLNFAYAIEAHAQYLIDFITDMQLGPVILYGHSLGGAIAFTMIDLAPDSCRQLILAEPNLDSGGGETTVVIAAMTEGAFITSGFEAVIQTAQLAADTVEQDWAASFTTWIPVAAYQISRAAVEGQTPSWHDILYGYSGPKSYLFGPFNDLR
ncbi:alpha/beta hydrolase fold protein [Brochothrix campestris FSL F6-1037]|uniref:Alpha/beta hydrolase fold protein n=2 Tax=Brochothrix campestris TaxID=2757 RepID=W7CKB8_9LIST|nr:alpha/beta hydrolase fold protein [Brochothrix campestris FSL F6-1037]